MMNPHAELNYSRRLGVEHEMTIPIIGSGGGQEVQETLAAVPVSYTHLRAHET